MNSKGGLGIAPCLCTMAGIIINIIMGPLLLAYHSLNWSYFQVLTRFYPTLIFSHRHVILPRNYKHIRY